MATGTSGSTPSLPFLREPVDVLRNGLPALKESASTSHPVEDIVKAHAKQDLEISGGMPMRQLYGSALPARLDIERQIASRPMRLPGFGLPSSKLGLEQISGQLGVMTPQDMYGRPEDSPDAPPSMHGLLDTGIGAKPVKRAMW